MTREYEISTCVSGSFKFKPEIDRLIEEFQDLHVKVLSPEKGWLAIPKYSISSSKFRPLPSETKMSVRQIEDNFLNKIAQANFLYVADFDGYTGSSVNFEIGFALGKNKPIYCLEKIKEDIYDLAYKEHLKSVKVMSPEEAVKDVREQIENSLDLQ
jgi:nucleoside 2-deoxyribosyltransferase